MNTEFRYTYYDANGNYTWRTVRIIGTFDNREKKRILASLDEGQKFIPRLVGFPEPKFQNILPEQDTVYCTLDTIVTSMLPATVELVDTEVVRLFEENKGHWYENLCREVLDTPNLPETLPTIPELLVRMYPGCDKESVPEESAAERLSEVIEMAAAKAGFKVIDNDGDVVVVRDVESDTDFAIHINELS